MRFFIIIHVCVDRMMRYMLLSICLNKQNMSFYILTSTLFRFYSLRYVHLYIVNGVWSWPRRYSATVLWRLYWPCFKFVSVYSSLALGSRLTHGVAGKRKRLKNTALVQSAMKLNECNPGRLTLYLLAFQISFGQAVDTAVPKTCI